MPEPDLTAELDSAEDIVMGRADMSTEAQASLFEIPESADLTHDWMMRPFGPNECASCLLLWFSGASHEETAAFLTETCPVKAMGAERQSPAIVYLA